MWNTNKVGGWELFKMVTENSDKLKNIPEDETDSYEENKWWIGKTKFIAFGKVKVNTKPKPDENIDQLYKEKIKVFEENKDNKETLIEIFDEKIAT